MSKVTWNLFKGAEATHHIASGYAITRIAIISELAPSQNSSDVQVFAEAESVLAALDPQVIRGADCPGLDFNVKAYLEQLVPELLNSRTVKMSLIYRGLPRAILEVDSALAQIETNVDKDNAPITVSYDYPLTYKLDPALAGTTTDPPQGGLVHAFVPEITLTFKFTLIPNRCPFKTDPIEAFFDDVKALYGGAYSFNGPYPEVNMARLTFYTGKVNKNAWNPKGLPGAPRTWMCTKMGGASKDGGKTVDGLALFQYRARTWDPKVVFIDHNTGQPPGDVEQQSGAIVYPKLAGECLFPDFVDEVN